MNVIREVSFSVAISADRYLAYYQGAAKNVIVTAHNGQRIQFPANVLQPYLTHDGIHGNFVLQFDENNKFVGIKKV